MKGTTLKWGICTAGRISNDFVMCLNALPQAEHKVCGVASRDLARAEIFAKSHSILKVYASYEELAADSDIDIVYIGTIHTEHFKLTNMMLNAGKHVLCEKPLCVTLAETTKVFANAKSKNRFLMEGIWSRFFPVYSKVREMIDSGVIGDVNHVQAQFGEFCETLAPRMCGKATAGGTLLDRGIYAVQFAQFVFNEDPVDQQAFGSLTKSGVDSACHIFLQYSNNRTAIVSTSVLANLPNEGVICGTKGTIKVCFPFWCPSKVEITLKYGSPEILEFPLPPKPVNGQFNFRNSEGFQYEAAEVRKCILNGLTECPLVTAKTSIQIAQIMEKARKAIGYDLPQDKTT